MKHRMSRAIDAVELKKSIAYSNILEDGKSLDQIIDEQPTIEPQQRWIPCSERMPEAGQKCLVCEKGTIAIDTYIGNGKPYDWRWYMRDYDAWMPLPEPYREGES